ncbi:MAG TPA: Type 1 glutamine amidotransferase-like domain-containing protein [Pyrinomonadaceae bacterium]|jgi:peptidase E
MNVPIQPIYLFADSQLLFWKNQGVLFLNSLRQLLENDAPKAAYVGASNGDAPEFYLIFEAAMEGIGIHNCRMVRSSFPAEDEAYLNEADIILLAGGDVAAGWKVFEESGIKELLIRRYYEGATLIGTSAGAVQLGLCGLIDGGQPLEELLHTFKLIPLVIDAHDEKQEWVRLKRTVRLLDGVEKGIGIPTGGGLIYYPNQSIEAIRHPLYEFSIRDGEIREALLMPGNERAE